MGNHFVMSKKLNKCAPADFGLISKDDDTAINPSDNSIWIKTVLYDFGWGKENGFYKAPLPDFDTLFKLALYSTNTDDMYGAAAVILDNFADELLCKCEELLMMEPCRKEEFQRLTELFKLKLPINRCSVVHKSYELIQSDYLRWKKIADIAMQKKDDKVL
jgi:hypothetical protein